MWCVSVQRQTTANESNPCSTGNSVNYSLSAIRFILRGMQDFPGRKSLLDFERERRSSSATRSTTPRLTRKQAVRIC